MKHSIAIMNATSSMSWINLWDKIWAKKLFENDVKGMKSEKSIHVWVKSII